MCVFVCECASVSVCIWFYKLTHGPQKQILVFFVWKFGFWPGEVMEKSWNFFLRFLWEPCIDNVAMLMTKFGLGYDTFKCLFCKYWFLRLPYFCVISLRHCPEDMGYDPRAVNNTRILYWYKDNFGMFCKRCQYMGHSLHYLRFDNMVNKSRSV